MSMARCAALSIKPQSGHQLVLYATSMLLAYQGRMLASLLGSSQPFSPALALAACLLSGMGLSGCAEMSDSVGPAFADPAKYDLYDCKQLETERKNLANRSAELQGLMDKAQAGAAGPVVAEIAYRNEYIAVRGQARNAEEAWQRSKCHETPPAAAKAVSAGPAPNDKPGRPSAKSGNAVY
jgi:hypothetical protein